jgi:uncharacterized coiled-coil protein SlyX
MAEKSTLGLILVVLVLITVLLEISTVYSQGSLRQVVIVYTPGLSPIGANNTISALNISASMLKLKLDGPLNPDYYAYWMLLGRKPELNNTTLLSTPDYNLTVNYTGRIRALWENALLVDIPLVNPELNISAVNTAYNLTQNTIKPIVLEVPVNDTTTWPEINTNVSTILEDSVLKITLDKYNVTLSVNLTESNITNTRSINVTDVEGLASGVYYVVFYVLDRNETSIKLFFPGSLRTSGFMSEEIKPVDSLLVPWTLIYRYSDIYAELPLEVREWIVNLTIDTTQRVIQRAISDVNKRVVIIYTPHIIVANTLNVSVNIEERLISILFQVFSLRVKQGALLLLFNPVATESEGLAVLYGNYTVPVDLEFTVSQFTSILLSYSKLSPVQNTMLLEDVVSLEERVRELESNVSSLNIKINELNNTLRETNETLQDTQNKLANCESYKDILESRLQGVDAELKRAEELERISYIYISTGLLVTVALAIILGFLTMRTCRVITPRLRGK